MDDRCAMTMDDRFARTMEGGGQKLENRKEKICIADAKRDFTGTIPTILTI
jgi:hypothetical protein